MFAASNDQQVMNLQIFKQSKVLTNLNKSLADELNQTTSLPTAHSNKTGKPKKPKNPWVGLLKKLVFYEL